MTNELSRRRLLQAAGIGGGALLASSLLGEAVEPARAGGTRVPPVMGLHLQFGEDASSEMIVSWSALERVENPRVLLGHLDGKLLQAAKAEAATYTDAKSGRMVYVWHAKL